MAYNVTVGLPFSRKHETEADRMGVELAARAGYNPLEAVRVWEKMSKISKGAPPEILSTHPSSATRIKDLTKYSKKVMPLYKKARKR
jgi:predicted Zn-dependent protease